MKKAGRGMRHAGRVEVAALIECFRAAKTRSSEVQVRRLLSFTYATSA